jgi:hypothetical protein
MTIQAIYYQERKIIMKKYIQIIAKFLQKIKKYIQIIAKKIKKIWQIFFILLMFCSSCIAGYGEFSECDFNFQDNNIEPKLKLQDEIVKDLLLRN